MDGIILKNDSTGIFYHSIGVNGARFEDYVDKTTDFMSQTSKLNPDIIIISLGTNETFNDQYTNERFKENLTIFTKQITEATGCDIVLFTTPPSALKKRKYTNKKTAKFTTIIKEFCNENQYAYWDLYEITGKENGMKQWYKKGFAAKDRIHYSASGYQLQGRLLFDAFLNSYHKLP